MRQFRKVAVLAALFVMVFSVGAYAAEYKLSNQLPPSHHISKGIHLFADKVKEYSGGKTTINVFDSAQLYKDTEILEAIQDGVVELGLVATNKWGGMVPAADVFDVPFLFVDLSSPGAYLDAGAGEVLDREFVKFGVKNVFWVDYGFIQMWNSKRPLRTPADFVGLTMRSYSAGDSETLKALGAAPTLMSSSEMYMALQRHTVDGATTGMPAGVSRKIYEVQKYLTIANYATAEFAIQANLEWWDGLDQETRDLLLKAGKEAELWIRGAIADSENEAEKTVRDAGLEVITLTAEERAALVEATKDVKGGFIKRAGDVGQELINIADKLFNK
ncbi:MAG TPA: C4-dicarboxylate ABC transporter substrate-binding protein [Synergistaceae bacterium]|nr:C4-dicarboxylate ABC transporter substrate-binding protein [Synergistaceae bacterium]